MDSTQIAKTALEIVRLGGQTLAGLNLHPVVTLAAGAVAGATRVALNAIDNAQRSEDEALAELKRALSASIAAVDEHLGDLEEARARADAKIAAAGPKEQGRVAVGDLVAAVQRLPVDAPAE